MAALPGAVALAARDNSQINLSDPCFKDVPQEVIRVLKLLDLDNTGQLSAWELEKNARMLNDIREAADEDGSGDVTLQEINKTIALMQRLTQARAQNSGDMEYKHLPAKIQEVFKTWDADESGKVSEAELTSAAKAWTKMQKENRMVKQLLIAAVVVIIIMFAGMFAMGMVTAELAKEFKASNDARMQTKDGNTVQTASSDFAVGPDGSMLLRGGASSAATNATSTARRLVNTKCAEGDTCEVPPPALKVATSESRGTLHSTLPDATFEQLKSLTLTSNGKSIHVTISSFQRVRVRSSKCGSVVHLHTPNGRMTLDDTVLMADASFELYVTNAGMHDLFGATNTGFGRRLSSTDGMLTGIFNIIESLDWACESRPLSRPEEVMKGSSWRAKVSVKHLHEQPENALSRFFVDAEDYNMPLPGVLLENGEVYKTWEEDIVSTGGIEAYLSTFALHPYTTDLRVKMNGAQLQTTKAGSSGFQCEVGPGRLGSLQNMNGDGMEMEFVGIVEEAGLILRHFRINMEEQLADGSRRLKDTILRRLSEEEATNVRAMVDGGSIPNMMDYFDIDEDPEGGRESGSPYRVRFLSTIPGTRVFSEKTYLSVETLPSELNVQGVLQLYGLTDFYADCKAKRLSDGTYASGQHIDDMFAAVAGIPGSPNAGDVVRPPLLHPWTEHEDGVLYHYDKLVEDLIKEFKGKPASAELRRSRDVPGYWNRLLIHDSEYKEQIKDMRDKWEAIRDGALARRLLAASGGSELRRRLAAAETNATLARELSSGRRVASDEREPSRWRPDVAERARQLSSTRRRGATSRRRSSGGKFKAEFEQGLKQDPHTGKNTGFVNLDIDVKQKFVIQFIMEWDAGNMGLTKLEGNAQGPGVIIYTPPTVTVSVSGGVYFNPPSTIGGFLQINGDVDIFWGYGFSVYLKISGEAGYVGGKVRVTKVEGELGVTVWIVTGKLIFTFTPKGPGDGYYEVWNVKGQVGYEVATWWSTYEGSFEITNFDVGSASQPASRRRAGHGKR